MSDETTQAAPAAVPSDADAATRLHEFETKMLGENVLRLNGKIEDGSGSAFSRLNPAHKLHHAALKALIEIEKVYGEAVADLKEAEAKLMAAFAHAETTQAASDAAKGN